VDNTGAIQHSKNQVVIIGFCGFKPSILQANHLLLSNLSENTPDDLFHILKGVLIENSFLFEKTDLSAIKICSFKGQKGGPIVNQACGIFGITAGNYPILIIWDSKENADLPVSDMNIFNLNEADYKLADNSILFNIIGIEQDSTAVSKQKPLRIPFEEQKSIIKYYSAPEIDPLFLPTIRKYVIDYLSLQSKDENIKIEDSLSFSLLPRNEGVLVKRIRKDLSIKSQRIPFRMISMPITIEQDEANRRGKNEDPEMQGLTKYFVSNIMLSVKGQQLFIDSSLCTVNIPDFFFKVGQPEAKSLSDLFKVTYTYLRFNEKSSPVQIPIRIWVEKSVLKIKIQNKDSNLPVNDCHVYIDYNKKNIYNEKIN